MYANIDSVKDSTVSYILHANCWNWILNFDNNEKRKKRYHIASRLVSICANIVYADWDCECRWNILRTCNRCDTLGTVEKSFVISGGYRSYLQDTEKTHSPGHWIAHIVEGGLGYPWR